MSGRQQPLSPVGGSGPLLLCAADCLQFAGGRNGIKAGEEAIFAVPAHFGDLEAGGQHSHLLRLFLPPVLPLPCSKHSPIQLRADVCGLPAAAADRQSQRDQFQRRFIGPGRQCLGLLQQQGLGAVGGKQIKKVSGPLQLLAPEVYGEDFHCVAVKINEFGVSDNLSHPGVIVADQRARLEFRISQEHPLTDRADRRHNYP